MLQKYGYHFNRMTRQCTRFSMNRTFVKFGVPATALFIDTYVIGSNADPQYGVTVNAWADNYGADGIDCYYNYSMIVTSYFMIIR